jgi:hypothetical protein
LIEVVFDGGDDDGFNDVSVGDGDIIFAPLVI